MPETKWVGVEGHKSVWEVQADTVRPWDAGGRNAPELMATRADKEVDVVFMPDQLFNTREEACKHAGVRWRTWTHWNFFTLQPGEAAPVPTDRRQAAYDAAKKHRQRCRKRKEIWDFSLTRRPDGSWVIIRTA